VYADGVTLWYHYTSHSQKLFWTDIRQTGLNFCNNFHSDMEAAYKLDCNHHEKAMNDLPCIPEDGKAASQTKSMCWLDCRHDRLHHRYR